MSIQQKSTKESVRLSASDSRKPWVIFTILGFLCVGALLAESDIGDPIIHHVNLLNLIPTILGVTLAIILIVHLNRDFTRSSDIKRLTRLLDSANKELDCVVVERKQADEILLAGESILHETQAALKGSERFLETVFEGIQDGISVLNPDMTIARANHAAKRLYYGMGPTDGKRCHELLFERAEPCDGCPAAAALQTGDIQTSVMPLPNNAGWIDFVAYPLFDDSHKIQGVINYARDITEQRVYEERIHHLARHDVLTNLPNRFEFHDSLEQNLRRCRQRKKPLVVLVIDLDRFKGINETFGHKTGDILLRNVAERLQGAIRQSDTLARMGGDEFTVILGDVSSRDEIVSIAGGLIEAVSKPMQLGSEEFFVTASIGIGIFPADGKNVEELIKNADTAMYRAKEEGRNNFQFYTKDMDTMTIGRMRMQNSLRRAIDNGELIVYYQPQLDVRSGRVEGVEALIRWQHPENGLTAPDKFIPMAEEIGFIGEITSFVLESACVQAQAWQKEGFPAIKVGVNVSGQDIQQGDLADKVRLVLEKTGLDPSLLVLEITEGALVTKPEIVAELMARLKELGVSISIDDFGTRYATLSNLKQFPLSCIKIDRLFVRNIETDINDAEIVKATVNMAHGLGLSVVAEGVETLAQFDFLRRLDCDSMQGYLISRPVPADDLTHLFTEVLIQPQAA